MDIFNCALKRKIFRNYRHSPFMQFCLRGSVANLWCFLHQKIKVVLNLFLPSTFIFVSIYGFYYIAGTPYDGVWRAVRVHSSECSQNRDEVHLTMLSGHCLSSPLFSNKRLIKSMSTLTACQTNQPIRGDSNLNGWKPLELRKLTCNSWYLLDQIHNMERLRHGNNV